ncbi:hypothetical protein JHD46_08370 [Sulfurimonas sp. SAG-AH-194-C20]|nr:hypothetical protein [Sulfurimonas sp. SAG-AH-194-C20]MDF1879649.1 hypothetical protein [Sulfurimonas sp. SAG-AH-194-C20]
MLDEHIAEIEKMRHEIVEVDVSASIRDGKLHTLSPILQFYGLCKMFGSLPGDIELESLDLYLKSEEDISSAMTIISIFSRGAVWTSIYALSSFLCLIAEDYTTPNGKLRPFKAEDISIAILCILFITGSRKLIFSENVNRFLLSSLSYYGETLPPAQILSSDMMRLIDSTDANGEKSKSIFRDTTTLTEEVLSTHIEDLREFLR